MKYSLIDIPFSRYGSYFAINAAPDLKSVYIRELHGGDESPSELYEVHFEVNDPKEWEYFRSPEILCFYCGDAQERYVKFAMEKLDILHIEAAGVRLKCTCKNRKYDTLVPLRKEKYEHHLYEKQRKIMWTCLRGDMCQRQDFTGIGSKNLEIELNPGTQALHCVIESYKVVPMQEGQYKSFETVVLESRESYDEWNRRFPEARPAFSDNRNLAVYLLWENFVHKEGKFADDILYMSKNWMNDIWSWDNCFSGIALSWAMPKKAWDQLKVFIDCQDESGVYADYVNESFASYNCTKPPIHAWAYKKMMRQNPVLEEEKFLRPVYESLKKVTGYWFRVRRKTECVFPVYYHGNDSGWDNASVFKKGFPVETPDLAAFLIRQMDILSEFAGILGERQEEIYWKTEADKWFGKFFRRFYKDGRFYGWDIRSNTRITEGDSLLLYLPVVIGYRFDKTYLNKFVSELLYKFETPYGLATENPKSPFYKSGGYWLGPVWAPVMYIFIDALQENGYREDANRLADKFLRLTKIGLMAENYDPFTGQGYDDLAFTWPSCVFLQIIKEYQKV